MNFWNCSPHGPSLHHRLEQPDLWSKVVGTVAQPPSCRALLCSPSCSASQEGPSQAAWFHHVLPQLRHLSWYGQPVREVNLGPGETLYLPSGVPHAVFNLEDNVSLTENYLASEGVTDALAAILRGDDDAGLGLCKGEERLWRSLYYAQLDPLPIKKF